MAASDAVEEPRAGEPRGQRKVAGAIGGAVQRLNRQIKAKRILWPLKGQAYNGVMPGEWLDQGMVDDTGCLPEECPVRPLGYDGENFYFEDTSGQVFNSQDKALGVERMQKLFAGNEDFLLWAWPSWSRGREAFVTGWKAEEARRDLYAACREKGPWTPTDKVRGRGAWRNEDTGDLILHCGEYLSIGGELRDTGQHGDYFYVRRQRTFEPWSEPVELDDNPALQLVEHFRTWNWVRGDVDVMLALGWIGVALLGAALDWRPSAFIIGDKGTGKSEFLRLLKAILRGLMVSTTNTTEAGLYQLVGHDAVPIAIDELEGEDAPEQAQKIIKMARDAASGSIRIRGGANHQGVEFTARSTFLFSAINPPPLPPASLSRLALLQLRPLEKRAGRAPVLKASETIGPMLLRRLVDGWEDWPRLFEAYRSVLRANGHDSRGQDTFGTFLAAAHTLLGDEGMEASALPWEKLDHWGLMLAAEAAPETANNEANWSRCLANLLSAPIDQWNKGERRTIGQILESASKDITEIGFSDARNILASADIGLIERGAAGDGFYLAVPHTSRAVNRLLADTPWGGKGDSGSWSTALGQAPGELVKQRVPLKRGRIDNRVTIGGVQRRCLFVDLEALRQWQLQAMEREEREEA